MQNPTLTIALFAFNQEKYVVEAVQSLFRQSYTPLQIILSDDCSTDNSYALLQDMASEYDGPHKVIVRKSKTNFGLLHHILSVAAIADGELLIVAAGDDISMENRVKKIWDTFCKQDSGVIAYSSDDIIIDRDGLVTDVDEERISKRDQWHKRNRAWIHGGTAAYRINFLKDLPMPDRSTSFEDMIFIDLMNIHGYRSIRSKEKLVKYRYHEGNISLRVENKKHVRDRERKAILRWRNARDAKLYVLKYIKRNKIENQHTAIIKDEYEYFKRIAVWENLGMKDKILLLKYGYKIKRVKSVFFRIFGQKIFYTLKKII